MKLKDLMGLKAFNKLKELLGDKVSDVEDVLSEECKEGNTEEGGTDKEEGTSDNDEGVEGEEDNSEDVDDDTSDVDSGVDDIDTTDKEEDAEGNSTDEDVDVKVEGAEDRELNVILGEGWLREDGTVDLDKVLDEALRGYIEGLHNKINDIDHQMLIELLKGEAKSQGAVDIEDIVKFVDLSTVSKDNVADSISKLKKDKGYLFKEGGKGFNPSVNKGKVKYRQGMSFGDAYDISE